MSLDNLAKIGRLKLHVAAREEIERLPPAAERNLRDANALGISDETRFDAAYKAVMQCALAGLALAGYRPATDQPGHHQTMVQSLPLTLGVDRETMVALDALRKKRNINDYTGDLMDPESLRQCILEAESLLKLARARLTAA